MCSLHCIHTTMLVVAATIVLALVTQQAAAAVDCKGADAAQCTSLLQGATDCTDNISNPTNNCGTVCTVSRPTPSGPELSF